MTSKSLLWLLIIIIFTVASCKKEVRVTETEPLERLTDSMSYYINGEKTISTNIERRFSGAAQSNLRITSGPDFRYLIQGDQDSVYFIRDFAIKANGSFINLTFTKIYNTDDTELTEEYDMGLLRFPKNKLDIFSTGIYKYSTDLWRKNSTSGIAIRMINEKGEFTSFGHSDLSKPASVTQNDQQGAKFEIISLQKRKSDYLLEAKFNLNLFNESKQVQRIQDGYLRLSVLKIPMN